MGPDPDQEKANVDPLLQIRRLWDHRVWADEALFGGLRASPDAAARREYGHVLGAEETWLARLEQRRPLVPVWPEVMSLVELDALRARVAPAYGDYLRGLTPTSLGEMVTYANSAGARFTTGVGDILLHVALHGQYHRGKVNLMLRQAGHDPVPVDFIAFVRGAPAAVTEPPNL